MALARQNRGIAGRGFEGLVLPGFIDALASLLLVVVFVLMVFFLIQTGLSVRITGHDTILERMRAEISDITTLLDTTRAENTRLDVAGRDLAAELQSARTREAELALRIEELQSQLAGLDATRITGENEIATLTAMVNELRTRLASMQDQLAESENALLKSRQAAASATRELLDAISSKPAELHRLRLVFFARLTEALAGRDDIDLESDRLVLTGLFEAGASELTPDAETRLGDIGAVLAGVMADIATDDGWVLVITAHAAAREDAAVQALAVVGFLGGLGYDGARLVAAGATDTTDPRIEFRIDTR